VRGSRCGAGRDLSRRAGPRREPSRRVRAIVTGVGGSSWGGRPRRRFAERSGRPTSRPLPDLEVYLADWSALHGGYDPRSNPLVRRWLGGTYRLARPLARGGVRPGQVTAAGVALSGVAVVPAAGGGRWPLAAAGAALGAALLDSLDGCVAILSGRVSPSGAVVDHVADRVSDAAMLGALVAVGAPRSLAVAGTGTLMGLEYTRAVARAAGFTEIGVVTVGERPTRVIVTVAGLVCASLFPGRAAAFAAAAAAAVAGLSLIGQAQFLAFVRRELR